MSEQRDERWEAHIHDTARTFRYPPTPDIAAGVRTQTDLRHSSPYRRLAWVAAVTLLVMSALLTVPEVRAVVLEVLRIGGITIFLSEPTATPTITPAPTETGVARTLRPTITPFVEPTPVSSVLDLPGETTLDAARNAVRFDIALPPDFGEPDRVFLQDLGGGVVTLVWLDTDGEVELALQILDERTVGSKYEPYDYRQTRVNGQTAYWLTGEHLLAFYLGPDSDFLRIVQSSVLIWEQDNITYRLETNTTLEEAVRIAESLE
jgi:hypothetical protein